MPNTVVKELNARDFDYWKAHHLLNRAGFGGTPGQVRALAKLGLHQAVDFLVDYQNIGALPANAEAFDPDIMRPMTAQERELLATARQGDGAARERLQMERMRRQIADRQQLRDMQRWWLKRFIDSPRPLEEKMTLFWHGHFATGYRAIEDSYHMFVQNQFFRANATGNFADLVVGIIRDPAMLKYLNNDQNRKAQPNENLARELMELFTLGEGNAYTERDIKEGARALTGYTFEDDAFVFRPGLHDHGRKRIFGKVGRWDGVDFCRLILSQRAASEYVCWKLYRYFVNDLPGTPDGPTQDFILKLARVFREGDYAIKPVLKAMFRSEHFYAPANRASVIKNPIQLMVQAARSLRTPVRNLNGLVQAANLMGQHLFHPPSVKGWDGGRSWINTSTMFVRQNLVVYLLTGRRPGDEDWTDDDSHYDATHLIEEIPDAGGTGPSPRDIVGYLLHFNLGAPPHPDRVDTLMEYMNARSGEIDNALLVSLLSLITAMPEYQLC